LSRYPPCLSPVNNQRIADRVAEARQQCLLDVATAARRVARTPRSVIAMAPGFTRLPTSLA
jgi:hypothetical protein